MQRRRCLDKQAKRRELRLGVSSEFRGTACRRPGSSDLAWCLGPGGLCRPGGQHVRGYGDAHPTHRPGPASAPGAATVSGNGVGLRLHPDGRPVAHQAMAGSRWYPDHGLWHRGGGVGSWSGVCVFCAFAWGGLAGLIVRGHERGGGIIFLGNGTRCAQTPIPGG